MVSQRRIIIFKATNDIPLSLELGLDPALKPSQQMTTLLYAKEFFKETLFQKKVNNLTLHFDEDNPTNEEEILTEDGIETVLVKPGSIADMIAAATITEKQEAQLYVNHKGQLIRVVPMEKNGKIL
jgi:hypothetical protein